MTNLPQTPPEGEDRDEDVFREDREDRTAMEALRELILGAERREIESIRRHLADRSQRAREIGEVLAEAIQIRSARDDRIAEALSPTIAETLRTSIRKDSKALGDALFPVMGPAIRKAIASTLWSMIQSLNQLLEHSVSLQGLKWRIEAIRTRKSFAEIVLLHTLVYRVEQVLLIMTESGVLLQHVVAREVSMEDPDLVSGMLTAIQDFVRDSFGASADDTLETLRMGDRDVRVEQHGGLTLAAVLRGNPPADFGLRMQRVLEAIHLKKAQEIETFQGDPEVFAETRPDLEACLETQLQEKKKRPSPLLWVIGGIVAVLLAVWLYRGIDENRRWQQVATVLDAQPGIRVTRMERSGGRVDIHGFKDPLAELPGPALERTGADIGAIRYHWEAFRSLAPGLVLDRLKRQAPPPETASMHIEGESIVLRGASLPRWPKAVARALAAMGAGVSLESRDLVDLSAALAPPAGISLTLKGRRLTASGTASHRWITAARQTAATLPEISGYDDGSVTDVEMTRLLKLKTRIEGEHLFFPSNSARLNETHRSALRELKDPMASLFALAESIAQPIHLVVIGEADPSGPASVNLEISQARADAVRGELAQLGLDTGKILGIGVGALRREADAEGQAPGGSDRRVRFRVELSNPPGQSPSKGIEKIPPPA